MWAQVFPPPLKSRQLTLPFFPFRFPPPYHPPQWAEKMTPTSHRWTHQNWSNHFFPLNFYPSPFPKTGQTTFFQTTFPNSQTPSQHLPSQKHSWQWNHDPLQVLDKAYVNWSKLDKLFFWISNDFWILVDYGVIVNLLPFQNCFMRGKVLGGKLRTHLKIG